MKDALGRTIDYMRISVMDKCSLRCKYYMPYEVECMPKWDIPSLEGIRVVGIRVISLDICHIKVAGSKPPVYRGRCQLVKQSRSIPGIEKVITTTNGVLPKRCLDDLTEAGIDGISIGLDTLDRDLYQRIMGTDTLGAVTGAVRQACATPLSVKVNVVSADFSQTDEEYRETGQDGQWQMVELIREYPVDVRSIEMMPIGYDKNFKAINRQGLLEGMVKAYPCTEENDQAHGFGSAVYYRMPGFKDSTGLISATHEKFCSGCNRMCLTSRGYLRPCLCYEDGVDLRRILREGQERSKEEEHCWQPCAGCPSDGESQRELRRTMEQAALCKPAAYCFERLGQVTEAHDTTATGGQSICQSK